MSSADFNNLVIRKTVSYQPDGSFVPDGYVFTVSTNGKQKWTNNLTLNHVDVSTLVVNSTFSFSTIDFITGTIGALTGSSIVMSTILATSTMTTSTLTTKNIAVSTLLADSFTTNALATSSLSLINGTGSTLNINGVTLNSTLVGSTLSATNLNVNAGLFSTMTGSTFTSNVMTSNSTLLGSTINSININYSTLIGNAITTNTLTIQSTIATSTITTVNNVYSSMIGSSLITNLLQVSTVLTGSTMNMTSIQVSTIQGSTIGMNYIMSQALNYSTLVGSTLSSVTISVSSITGSTINFANLVASTFTTSTVTANVMFPLLLSVSTTSTSVLTASTLLTVLNGGQVGVGTTAPICPVSFSNTAMKGLEMNAQGSTVYGSIGNYGSSFMTGAVYTVTNPSNAARVEYAYAYGGASTLATAQPGARGFYAIDLAGAGGAFGTDTAGPAAASFYMNASKAVFQTSVVGIGATNPNWPLTVAQELETASILSPLNTQLTLTGKTKTGTVKIGAFYTTGTGKGVVQSSDVATGNDVGLPLLLNPLGGSVGMGTTNVTTANVQVAPYWTTDLGGGLTTKASNTGLITASLIANTGGNVTGPDGSGIYSFTTNAINGTLRTNTRVSSSGALLTLSITCSITTGSGSLAISNGSATVSTTVLTSSMQTIVAQFQADTQILLTVVSASGTVFKWNAFSVLRLDTVETGNIGIGTTVPNYMFDLYSPIANYTFLNIGGNGGTGNTVGINLSPWYSGNARSGGPETQIISIDDGAGSAHMSFWTAPVTGVPSNGAGQTVERMRITNDGYIGIGTTTPGTSMLSIYGVAKSAVASDTLFLNVLAADSTPGALTTVYSNSIKFNAGDLIWGGSTRVYGAQIYIGGGYVTSSTTTNGQIKFFTGGAERMRVHSNGFVGINNTNPLVTLDITGSVNISGTLNVATSITGAGFPIGIIVLWYGTVSNIPSNWALCNGSISNGVQTPDLRKKFIVGVNSDVDATGYKPYDTGGSDSITLTTSNMPAHTHDLSNHTHTINSHTHDLSNHTHTINSHTHSLSGHTHDLANHTHAGAAHTHGLKPHAHDGFAGPSSSSNSHSGGCAQFGYGDDFACAGYTMGVSVGTDEIDHTYGSTYWGGDRVAVTLSGGNGSTGTPSNNTSGGPSNDSTGGSGSLTSNSPNTNTTGGSGSLTSNSPNTNTSGSNGSGTSFDNRPAYYALCYIIKVA